MTAPVARPTDVRHDLVLRRGGLSVRVSRRSVAAVALLAVLGTTLGAWGLTLGDYPVGLPAVVESLVGRGDGGLAAWFVTELRAPRVCAALLVGAALGASGAVFQNVTGNPLGSPDIIGFTTGAATGALVQIVLVGESGNAVALGALLGGVGTAVLVRLLVGRNGLTGQRIVLVGIGVGATLAALNTLLVVQASLESAQQAGYWLAGSLNAVQWPRVHVLAPTVVVLVLLGVLLDRPLRVVVLGDDAARAVGVDASRVRAAALALGVVLVAVATAVTGPVAFVALAAPQVARRLVGAAVPATTSSALTGAVLVLGSDLLAQHALGADELPVGVVTGALGGLYLIGLLALDWRKR